MSHPDITIQMLAKQIASTMYNTKTKTPKNLRKKLWHLGWFDPYSQKTESFIKLIVLEYLKILFKKMDFKFLKSYEVVDERIKCHIWQHDFLLDKAEFTALTIGTNPFPSHPLNALVDCIFCYEIEAGCERCGFSEDGCEACAFNKARRMLNQSDKVLTFKNTGHKFFDVIGKERSETLLDLARDFNNKISEYDDLEEEEDEDEDEDEEGGEFLGELDVPKNMFLDEQEIFDEVLNEMDDDEEES